MVIRSQSFPAIAAAAQGFALGQPAASLSFPKWNYAERVRFLNALPRELPEERLSALDSAFGLSKSTNSEVLFAWLQLAIANRYDAAVPAIERFLTGQGRRKFVAPLFDSLVQQGEWGRPIATRIFAQAKSSYHSVTAGTVEKTLNAPPQKGAGTN